MKKVTTILIFALAMITVNAQNSMRQNSAQFMNVVKVESTQSACGVQALSPVSGETLVKAPMSPATNTIFFDGFETSPSGGGFPTGWTSIGTLGGNAWTTTAITDFPVLSGSKYARILYHQTVAHNAWLITPAIALTAGKSYNLEFLLSMAGYQGALEDLEVKIGNAATAAAMTTLLLQNTADYETWTNIPVRFTVPTTGNYYIGFHAKSPADVNYIAIDDISVTEFADNDLALEMSFPYSQVPTSQTVSVSGKAKNIGNNPQTNITLAATLNGTSMGSVTPISSLASGALSAAMSFAPASIVSGNNSLVCTVSATETDANPENNSATYSFTGTQNVYAVDNLSIGNRGVGSNLAPITFGNVFEISSETTLSQVAISFANPTSLAYSISLYKMTGDLTISSTPLFTHNATRNAVDFAFVNVPTTVLTPGSYYLCVNQLSNTNISVSYDADQSKVSYRKDMTNLTPLPANLGAVAIRMVLENATTCNNPTNLAVEPDYKKATFSWDATAARYVMMLTIDTISLSFYTINNSVTIINLPIGTAFTWRVAALCDAIHNSDTIDGPASATLSCTAIKTFPWAEGFENNDTDIPICWSQQQVKGTDSWTVVTRASGVPNSVHGGTYKAFFNPSVIGNATKLITSPLDLTALTNPALKFYHTQHEWVPNQDTLRIYYKNSETSEWVLLKTYSNNIDEWAEEIIALPNKSNDYYIAFEGISAYAQGIQLDDITVLDYTNGPDAAILSANQPVSNANLTATETVKMTIKNFSSTSITSLPVTLEVNGTTVATETITDSIPYLAEYEYTFTATADLSVVKTHNIKLYTGIANDGNNSNDTIQISVTNYGDIAIMGNIATVTNCNIPFFDDGVYGKYIPKAGQVETITFLPETAGDRVKATFTEFSSYPSFNMFGYIIPGDSLLVYEGSAANSNNLIAVLTDNMAAKMPLSFTSFANDGALTFAFHKNSGVADNGWKADIECITPLDTDIAVLEIDAPIAGELTTTETITVTIRNLGGKPISNIPLVCTVNEVALPTATIAGPIAPGAFATQNFTANLSPQNVYHISAYVDLSTDMDHSNDTIHTTTASLPSAALTWDFEQGIPDFFTFHRLDNGVANSTFLFPNNEAWAIFSGTMEVSPIGTKCAASQSWFSSGNGVANRWMITPQISIKDGLSILQWDSRAYEIEYRDNLIVKISTTNNDPASFTTTLLSINAEKAEWTNHVVDLSSYHGQVVYIAFVQNSDDQNMILVDNIKILGNAEIGIEQITINPNVRIYPNPATDIVTIEGAQGANVKIYDITGKTLITTTIQDNHETINISKLSSGVYFIDFQDNVSRITRKLIKK